MVGAFRRNDDGGRTRRGSARCDGLLLIAVGLTLVAAGASAETSATPSTPAQSHPAGAVVAADPMFAEPYIDIDEWRDTPVRHHYIHGGFKGVGARFSFYFPPKEQFKGRFFQHITPVPDSENLAQHATGADDKIGFSIASGGYFVETNGGGADATGGPGFVADPTIAAWRANAAAARFSRVVAARLYGPGRIYGYAYGGSGGGFRTIGSIENTTGVWDGVVPYVIGSPLAIPNTFTVRMHAMRILQDKFPQIVDALEPGGGGDMYVGLDDEERDALREVTRMGFPPGAWFGYKTMGVHGFNAIYPGMVAADPTYFTDFWTKPGYLGANPPASLVSARIQHKTTVKRIITVADTARLGLNTGSVSGFNSDAAWRRLHADPAKLPVGFELTDAPPNKQFLGGDLIILSGAAAGGHLQLHEIVNDVVLILPSDPTAVAALRPGDEVQVDNSNFLAAQTYHRHQVPGPEYQAWDQFRGPDGKPIYPQRPVLLGPIFTKGAVGALPTGKFQGKMIVVDSLWDREAFPWQADWYRTQVQKSLGNRFNDNFRIWYTEHALHNDLEIQEDPTHTVQYLGLLNQALRDLSVWVERDIPPPASTNYKVVDGQVIVPPTAAERGGIQPVVKVKANGGMRADVAVGQPVTFTARVVDPPKTGRIVSAEWDFEGAGDFPVKAQIAKPYSPGIALRATYTFTKPGTYFPTLRATSQRGGDAKTPFARIQNLDRVRVVVK